MSQHVSATIELRNQKELQKLPNWKKYELLTKSTDPKRISGYVAAATNKGQAGHRDAVVQVVSVFASKDSGCDEGLILQTGKVEKLMHIFSIFLSILGIPMHVDEVTLLTKTFGRGLDFQMKQSKIASRQEDRTKQWEQLLFSNATREVKLSKLAAWNEERDMLGMSRG
eukprot:s93_g12.t1